MKIDARNKQYEQYAPKWQRCRDAAAGGDEVKGRGAAYLPELSGQDTSEYSAYQMRADWYGATSRTIQGLTGAVFRREPQTIYPTAGQVLLDDVTLTGRSAVQVAGQLLDEIETVGRVGLYVDYPRGPDAEPRPYWVVAPAERVINWGTDRIAGRSVLSWVVIEESVSVPTEGDRYTTEAVDQWRVLELDEAGLYRKGDDPEQKFVEFDRVEPLRRGERLSFIPFLFINPSDLLPDVDRPPLLDLVDINLSHYRTSADLEHGRHYTGLEQKADAEAAETVRLRQAGQSATMARIVDTLDEALTRAAGWLLWWGGGVAVPNPPSEQVAFMLNRDLIGVRATLSDIQGIVQAFQGGLMSFETSYYNLERLEMTRPDVDVLDELELIDDRAEGELLRAGELGDDERVEIQTTVDNIVANTPV